jgi:hypothetical protein
VVPDAEWGLVEEGEIDLPGSEQGQEGGRPLLA